MCASRCAASKVVHFAATNTWSCNVQIVASPTNDCGHSPTSVLTVPWKCLWSTAARSPGTYRRRHCISISVWHRVQMCGCIVYYMGVLTDRKIACGNQTASRNKAIFGREGPGYSQPTHKPLAVVLLSLQACLLTVFGSWSVCFFMHGQHCPSKGMLHFSLKCIFCERAIICLMT